MHKCKGMNVLMKSLWKRIRGLVSAPWSIYLFIAALAIILVSIGFMDNDEAKLNIYGKMAKHVSYLLCPELDFEITSDAVFAIKDADYVITTIREGGDDMRVADERIALSYGVLGQETTGAAGFSFAMRSVKALCEYCEIVKKYAKPNCKVFNFTNPAGVVSQTLRDMGYAVKDTPQGQQLTKI